VVLSLAFGVVCARLVYVQALASDRYAAVGVSQRLQELALPPSRGAIFDRAGRELALSVRQTTVVANPRVVDDPAGVAAALAPLLGVGEDTLRERLGRDAAFVYLARKVDDATAAKVRALELPGVSFVDEPKRFNPAGDLAAPVLGLVGTDHEGLSGLELQYERPLAGAPGRLVVEQDPSGREIPGGLREHRPPSPGDDLVLTIDRSLQYETERALAAQIALRDALGGIAIVMESRTGEVLALANLVAEDRGGPVRAAPSNTALTHAFEPGSVNKLITLAAAIEEGLVEPETRLVVPPTLRVADKEFKEHDPHPTVQWSVTDVMAESSNVGTILLGQRVGKQRLDAYLRAFGFGERTALGFPGESAGIMLDPARWSGTSIGTISIGQGVAVTAVQMLAAYNTVANGGEYVAPKLVRAVVGADGRERPTPPSARRRVVSPETAAQVNGMLQEVVRRGTGINAAIDGYRVAGKTGTARKPLVGARGYKAGAYMSSFAGFVPAERPALTSIVILDEPTPIYGGTVAAPVFAEVLRYGLRQLRIPPVGTRPAGAATAPVVAQPAPAPTTTTLTPVPDPRPAPR
jgi:cell division protein FtsI (penicillin-binding protein 3)